MRIDRRSKSPPFRDSIVNLCRTRRVVMLDKRYVLTLCSKLEARGMNHWQVHGVEDLDLLLGVCATGTTVADSTGVYDKSPPFKSIKYLERKVTLALQESRGKDRFENGAKKLKVRKLFHSPSPLFFSSSSGQGK